MSQNFRLFHVSNLSVLNFRFFLLMYLGSQTESCGRLYPAVVANTQQSPAGPATVAKPAHWPVASGHRIPSDSVWCSQCPGALMTSFRQPFRGPAGVTPRAGRGSSPVLTVTVGAVSVMFATVRARLGPFRSVKNAAGLQSKAAPPASALRSYSPSPSHGNVAPCAHAAQLRPFECMTITAAVRALKQCARRRRRRRRHTAGERRGKGLGGRAVPFRPSWGPPGTSSGHEIKVLMIWAPGSSGDGHDTLRTRQRKMQPACFAPQ